MATAAIASTIAAPWLPPWWSLRPWTRRARASLQTDPSALEATAQGVARRWRRWNSECGGGEPEEEEAVMKRRRPASSQHNAGMEGPSSPSTPPDLAAALPDLDLALPDLVEAPLPGAGAVGGGEDRRDERGCSNDFEKVIGGAGYFIRVHREQYFLSHRILYVLAVHNTDSPAALQNMAQISIPNSTYRITAIWVP